MKQKRRYNKNKVKAYKLLALTIMVTILAFMFSKSKFIAKLETPNYAIEASKFYFTSDYLVEDETKEIQLSDWKIGQNYSFEFLLKNYEDSLRASAEDISYNIEIQNNSNANITYTDSGNGKIEKGNYKENTITINIDDQKQNVEKAEFTVIVTTTSKYTKVLRCNFAITKESEKSFEAKIKENSQTVKLNIITYDTNSNLTISYNNTKITVDKSNQLLDEIQVHENGETSSFQVNLQANNSYIIDFVKKNKEDKIDLEEDININE